MWSFDPTVAAPVLLAMALYAIRVRHLHQAGRAVPIGHRLSYYGGWLLVLLALASPLDWLGEERLLTAHMAQHVLLGDLGPLLIVLGLSGPILRPVLALPGVGRLSRAFHPLLALGVWVANLYVWHLPVMYEAALGNDLVHAVEHASFLACGLLAWWFVVEPIPAPRWFGTGSKVAFVFALRFGGLILANVLLWTPTVIYGWYADQPRIWGVGALEDQEYAGGLMMLECSLVTLGVLLWLLNGWADESERRQQLADAGFEARGGRARRPVVPGPPIDGRPARRE